MLLCELLLCELLCMISMCCEDVAVVLLLCCCCIDFCCCCVAAAVVLEETTLLYIHIHPHKVSEDSLTERTMLWSRTVIKTISGVISRSRRVLISCPMESSGSLTSSRITPFFINDRKPSSDTSRTA